jgi:hypothetical protein
MRLIMDARVACTSPSTAARCRGPADGGRAERRWCLSGAFFDYADSGSYNEETLRANRADRASHCLAEAAKVVAATGGPEPMTIAGDLRTLEACEQVFTDR